MDLLDEGEHAWLDGWGNRAVLSQPVSTPVSIPVLFAAQVARAPEAVALSCGGRSLTYREVEEAANRLAHLLAAQGVGPGECVGSVWGCFFPARPRRSWQSWRCSRPGRLICRSTRRCSVARTGFMIEDDAPIAAITTAGLRSWRGATWRSSMSKIPAFPAIRARARRRQPPMASPTSSTPRAPPVSPSGGRHHHNVTPLFDSLDACLPRAGVWSNSACRAANRAAAAVFNAANSTSS
jgi:non-ribosomal peptide synthetase component F